MKIVHSYLIENVHSYIDINSIYFGNVAFTLAIDLRIILPAVQ